MIRSLAVLLMLAAMPALAQTAPAVTAAARDYDSGKAEFKAKRYGPALALFLKAEPFGAQMGRLPAIRWNIARAYEELKAPTKEVAALERCLEVLKNAERKAVVVARIAVIEKTLLGSIDVKCAQSGTQVALGGSKARTCPARFTRLAPGARSVSATLASRPFPARTVEVQAGKTNSVEFPAGGGLSFPAASGYAVNGGAVSGPMLAPIPPGSYVVTLATEDGERSQTLAVRADETTQVTLVPHVESASSGPWILGGTGAGLVVLGGVFVGVGLSHSSDADSAFKRYEAAADTSDSDTVSALRGKVESSDDSAALWQTAGIVAIGAGAAMVAGAVWWGLEDGPVVTPTASPGQVGVAWRGGF